MKTVELSDGMVADAFETLAAAYAETGQFGEAIEAAEKGLSLTIRLGQQRMADQGRDGAVHGLILVGCRKIVGPAWALLIKA